MLAFMHGQHLVQWLIGGWSPNRGPDVLDSTALLVHLNTELVKQLQNAKFSQQPIIKLLANQLYVKIYLLISKIFLFIYSIINIYYFY